MLIVGLAAAAMAIAACYVWFFAKRGRKLWGDRNAEKLLPDDPRPKRPRLTVERGDTVSSTDLAKP